MELDPKIGQFQVLNSKLLLSDTGITAQNNEIPMVESDLTGTDSLVFTYYTEGIRGIYKAADDAEIFLSGNPSAQNLMVILFIPCKTREGQECASLEESSDFFSQHDL